MERTPVSMENREYPFGKKMLETLFSEHAIATRVKELGKEISDAYGNEPIVAVGILKGSIYFLSDLTRELPEDVELDFIQVSSYHGQKTTSGVVQIRKDLDTNIEGKNVLIIEDIVDTGTTLDHLRELLATRHPKTLRVATLLSKRIAKNVATQVEFVGFEIPDEFVVGYGLDYGERYRNLPQISILREA